MLKSKKVRLTSLVISLVISIGFVVLGISNIMTKEQTSHSY
ncbi:hypothetical protein [Staphylococcus delphini]|nr:hypothetical protein [Staphylococcus delphini]